MSSVTPTENSYAFQASRFDNAEEEIRKQAKEKAALDDERIARIEENYKTQISKNAESLEETARTIRENSNETVKNDRERSALEIDHMKKATYDKRGRYSGEEIEIARSQLADGKAAWDIRHADDRKNLAELGDTYEQRIRALNKDHANELERQVEAARDGANEAYHTAYDQRRSALDDQIAKSKATFEELNRTRMADTNESRRQANMAVEEAQERYNKETRQTDRAHEQRYMNRERAWQEASERNQEEMNRSREEEGRSLRSQVKDLLEHEKRYSKEKGQGTKDAIAEFEDTWRDKIDALNHTQAMEIDKIKGKIGESEEYLNERSRDVLRAREQNFAQALNNTLQEARMRESELSNAHDKDRAQMTQNMNKSEESSRLRLEHAVTRAAEDRSAALQTQARSYQDTLKTQKDFADDQIDRLQAQLQNSATSSDTSVVSPAAEEKIRKTVIQDYEKVMAAERERNNETVGSTIKEYSNRLHEEKSKLQYDMAEQNQQSTADRHRDRTDLLHHIQDTEQSTASTLRNQEGDHARLTDNLNKNYARMLTRQQKQYEEMIATMRNDSVARLQQERQALEFQNKTLMRDAALRQNDIIRQYEKRMNEQKMEAEVRFEDMKIEADRTLRESEKRAKQDLENQARAYDQKIAQTEAQQKEKERYLVQNFEDNLDRVKRANAEHVRKKS